MRNGRKGSEIAGKVTRHSLFIKATVFYIFSADYKRILRKMDLVISKPSHHKTLIRQGVISDAFIKSKYDSGILNK